MTILLPFPSSLLAGHAKGNDRWAKIKATKEHREWANYATKAALRGRKGTDLFGLSGDISLVIRFVPPNNRGDRVNFPNRMKPIFDGIADALGVNDSRFLPSYHFAKACAPGHVSVDIAGLDAVVHSPVSGCNPSQPVEENLARAEATNKRSGQHRNALVERSI